MVQVSKTKNSSKPVFHLILGLLHGLLYRFHFNCKTILVIMQKHKLPSSSTIRQSALEQDGAASNIINVPPMHQTVTPIPVPTRTAAANEPSSLFAAALNLPDLAARKEMAFKKKTASSRSVSISREGSQAEASPSRPPPPAGASRHSGGLSAELSGPLAALDSVTASLRSRGKDGDADEARWKGTVKNLTVGRCGSISSSPLNAYANP